MKKFDLSTSFAVAPHCMLILNIWARRARLRWNGSPPKKTFTWLVVFLRGKESERAYCKHWHPFEVLAKTCPKTLFRESIPQDGERDVPHCAEKDDETEEHFP